MLVTFCLGLLGTLGVVFTRVIAARVPEQRATLEKLITDRTGLAVRFDNVHFAWNLDGTSAVFERVELTDPKRGRVRVSRRSCASSSTPGISCVITSSRWATSRCRRRTSRSSAIRKTGAGGRAARAGIARGRHASARTKPHWCAASSAGPSSCPTAASKSKARACTSSAAAPDRVARQPQLHAEPGGPQPRRRQLQRIRHHAALAGCRPVPVRVRQARRAAAGSRVSGDLRVIARRVFLDKLAAARPARAAARSMPSCSCRTASSQSATWQASARELQLNGDAGTRFDHLTGQRQARARRRRFPARIRRPAAHARRAPGARAGLHARLDSSPALEDRAHDGAAPNACPFMAAEFVARLLAPQFDDRRHRLPGGWAPTAGELRERALRFGPSAGFLGLAAVGASSHLEPTRRAADHATVAQLAAHVHARCARAGAGLRSGEHRDAALRVPRRSPARVESRRRLWRCRPAMTRRGSRTSRCTATPGTARSVEGEWNPARETRAGHWTSRSTPGRSRAAARCWTLLAADSAAPGLVATSSRA